MVGRGKSWKLMVGGVACLVALVVVTIWTRDESRAAYRIAFSPRGDRVAAVVEGKSKGTGQLLIWDPATGRQVLAVTAADRLLSMAFAPDGTALATGGWSGSVDLWEPATGRHLRSFSGHSFPVRGLAFLPDGRRVVAGASDGVVIVWDLATGRPLVRLDRGVRLPVNALAVSHDGRFLAAAGGSGAGVLSLWDLESARLLKPGSLAGASDPIAFGPDQAVLAVRSTSPNANAMVSLVDLDGDRSGSTTTLPGLNGVRSLAFSPDGRLVATAGDDATIHVQEVQGGQTFVTIRDLRQPQPAVSGGDNVHRALVNLGLAEPRGQNTIWSVAFSPDGTRLASASQDGCVDLWALPGRQASTPLNRVRLRGQNRPVWLLFIQGTLVFVALALLVLATRSRRDRLKQDPVDDARLIRPAVL